MKKFIESKDCSSPFSMKLLSTALHSALNDSEEQEPTSARRENGVDSSFHNDRNEKTINKVNGSPNEKESTIDRPPRELSSSLSRNDDELKKSPDPVTRYPEAPEDSSITEIRDASFDRSLDKKMFFSSDSEDDSEESDESNKSNSIQKKIESKNAGMPEKSIKSTPDSHSKREKNDEKEDELNGLLRLANRSLTEFQKTGVSQLSNNNKKPWMKKPKTGENDAKESLLDFINDSHSGEIHNEETAESFPAAETRQEENFESQINKAVKASFLLSSSDFNDSLSEEENKSDGINHKKMADNKKSIINSKEETSVDESEDEKCEKEIEEEEEEEVKKTKNRRKRKESESESTSESEESSWECEEKATETEATSDDPPDEKISRKKDVYPEVSISSESSDSDIQQISIIKPKNSPVKGRKNINKIIGKDSLEVGTKAARKLEAERKKRLSERQKILDECIPSSDGRKLILDFDPVTKKELVVVDENLCKHLKPHQREGVKFMWDSCFESLERIERDPGSGCILAHCMGLGKTLQVITLIHTIFAHETGVKTILILCPLNTVKNWLKEFKKWLSDCKGKVNTFEMVSCRTRRERSGKLKIWWKIGGVLVMSYEIFRSMMNGKTPGNKVFLPFLSDPGPDLVVCDEGHLLKNMKTALSKCISRIKTLRRIVLTGTPLQNNLIEYYCMVQFVKPNILGTMKEFLNGFVNPIKNGQFEDSTQMDVRIMKRRAHVLHSLLKGFIQRFGYCVLTPLLPEKQEYVISVSLTKSQDQLYRLFVEKYSKTEESTSRSPGLLKDFHWLQKIWTHPRVMLNTSEKQKFDLENLIHPERMYENWEKFVGKDEYDKIESSGKLVLLFKILKICHRIGDKILVFSQYLSTLNLIEHFLQKANNSFRKGNAENFQFADHWILGLDYYRIDGSTSPQIRFEYCKKFNDPQQRRFRLFLISTRAGGMGINLIRANRVVVFDVSWNPSHDLQSIFRVYRFGQTKPCYIYRFLAEATMEEKIYKRQVTKLSLALRIVDEHQIERHYSMMNLHELYSYDPTPKNLWKVPNVPKDSLFAEILASSRDIIVGYHEHDSLLENKEEEELTEEERRAAWEDFEKDRFNPIENSLNSSDSIYPTANQRVPNVHKKGFVMTTIRRDLVFNEQQNQMCKIIDVRTLNPPEERSLGMPEEGQIAGDSYIENDQLSTGNYNHNFYSVQRPVIPLVSGSRYPYPKTGNK